MGLSDSMTSQMFDQARSSKHEGGISTKQSQNISRKSTLQIEPDFNRATTQGKLFERAMFERRNTTLDSLGSNEDQSDT